MDIQKEKNKPNVSAGSNPWKDFQRINLRGDIFKQIFKYSIIPTLVHDMEMNIINANDSAVEEFGFSRKELLKKSIFDLHTEDELNHSAAVLEKMKREEKLSVETSFKRKDGSVFMAEATPCKYMVGDKPMIHVFIQDITERKQAEKKLLELNTALESEIAKVEEHSHQIQLKNKELKDFAYVAAHDLKAPLINISTLAEMINTEALTDKQNIEVLGRLKKSIALLHKTVYTLNDVIAFKTTLKDRKERLKFEEIFNEIKESLANQLETSNASIKEDFSECPEIDYPPLHLKSVIQNLLTNAVRYKDPDKLLNIEVKTFEQNGMACFSVKDNGLGFDSEKYSGKIFGLFTRLHAHVEGKGVGMHIVKSIIDAHGGKIEIKSKPKEGALFNVYLNNGEK